MKTSESRNKKKAWQKADARVLGQILAAQNIEFALPDTTHLAEFFAEILVTIPGVTACRICLEDVSVKKGEMELGICAECRASRKKANGQKEFLAYEPDFKCGLANQPGIQFNAIDSLQHHFGFFVFQIGDPDIYNIYKPFIGNLANYVAISLENRLQKELLQKARDELEHRVVERTQDLAMINAHLQEEIENRQHAEDALQERERHSQSLLRLSRKLESAQTYTEVLNAARDEVRNVIGYQNLWAYLLSEDKKYFKALIAEGPMSDTVMSDGGTATLTIEGDKMLEEIAQAKEIVVIEDARVDGRTNKEIVALLGNRTIVNIPIMLFDRHLGSVGTGTFGEEGARPPTESEQKYLIALASHMAVTLDRIHLLDKREQVEQALRESEARYRNLVEQADDGIFVADQQGNYLDVNPSGCNMLGYTREEILTLNMRNLVRFEDQVKAPLRLDELRSGKNIISERNLITKSGALLPVEINGKVLDNGNFLGFVRDITERKRVEEKIKQHIDELERWYNATLNREERVQELKREVNQLLVQMGEPARYANPDG